jgi:hypothetical protein
VPAALLADQGVLVFNRYSIWLCLVEGVVEEAARAAIQAQSIGVRSQFPAEMRIAALQRAMAFDSAGTVRA